MALSTGTRLIDAATVLVGWINYSATDPFERTRVSGEVVKLSTALDAAGYFSLIASHTGATAAITVLLELAPLLEDGTPGSFVEAATAAIPAGGGRIETVISGGSLLPAAADTANVISPAFYFARASLTPETPTGAFVGLTAIKTY